MYHFIAHMYYFHVNTSALTFWYMIVFRWVVSSCLSHNTSRNYLAQNTGCPINNAHSHIVQLFVVWGNVITQNCHAICDRRLLLGSILPYIHVKWSVKMVLAYLAVSTLKMCFSWKYIISSYIPAFPLFPF